jgi:hypothetical protein
VTFPHTTTELAQSARSMYSRHRPASFFLASAMILGLASGAVLPTAGAEETPTPTPVAAATPFLPTPTQTPTAVVAPSVGDKPVAAVKLAVAKPKKPKAATRERKAKNVPWMPLDDGKGRRIVYDKALMTVWAMNKKNEVVFRFPIVGRWDRPVMGKYRIFSKSPSSGNPNSRVTFDHMVRFAFGNDGKTAIGFHSIPRYYDGKPMHSTDHLGLPVATGGCVRMAPKAAKQLYEWSKVGDKVVVLPSP